MRVLDLFSGCGGLSLGFQQAGFEVVAAFDNWKEACSVYSVNFDHPVYEADLSDRQQLSALQKWEPDMIIGGPPCQDFSSAGKRDESQGRADLTVAFAEYVTALAPRWFVMENVERIITSNALQEAVNRLKAAGYGLTKTVLDASYCGVPQTRKRFFMIGGLEVADGFLDYRLLKNQSQKQMTVYDYLGNQLPIQHYYRHPRSYARRGIFSVHEPSATIRGVNRPVPPNYQKHDGDSCYPNESLRSLTTYERSLIQTFPDDFIWLGSKTQQEQMIGNAVPVRLAKYVADCLQEYLANPDQNQRTTQQLNAQLELFA
jgi:DNA (cytosine-5)-methyltransferase 1